VGVRCGEDGFGFFEEILHEFVELLVVGGVFGGEVFFFADVAAEVVEFVRLGGIVEMDEFPVAVSNNRTRCASLVSPVWVVPEEGVACGL